MHPLSQFQMRAAPVRARKANRATELLHLAARARLTVLPSSVDTSGSEHEAATLSSLVNEYLLETDATVPSSSLLTVDQDSDGEDGHGRSGSSAPPAGVVDEIRAILDPSGPPDDLRLRLVAVVGSVVEGLDEVRESRSAFRRAVMSRLRERGHDAGLCKARWDKSSGMVAGSYEYIDVIVSEEKETRFIVDMGFAAEFEVARPTAEFEAVSAVLPEFLVAPAEDVRRLIKVAASAARRSLKSQGLSVPPWRKRRFMVAKWFGPYRRTVNVVPASAGAAIAGSTGAATVCATILGFGPLPTTGTSSALLG
ncbi:hypothetical protein PVAP13_8KG231400 [Panicum virgatum]|uniref:DUF506 family protein n=2 Tax=Panicum virgatum TaxID=38727 RepID=A0A8T0PL36_PANVG|nr:hypothetical protein PVAP13_8KG231400 [Panicum virgatum]